MLIMEFYHSFGKAHCTFNLSFFCLFCTLKKLLEFIVYTNLWVALAVASLSAVTFKIIGQFSFVLIAFSFFATLFMYAYARWFIAPGRDDESASKLSTWKDKNRLLHILSGTIGAVGAIYFALKLNQTTLFWVLVCGGISALYPLQFLKHGQLALRNVAGLKLFVISAVWAVVTTVLPAMQSNLQFSFELGFLTLQRFLFVMAITIPFDIRDLRVDSPDINTLPYRLGVKNARRVALFALFLAEIGAVVMFFSNLISASNLVGQIFAFEATSTLIYRSSPKRPDLFFSFGVEGTSILLFSLVYIFTYFWP